MLALGVIVSYVLLREKKNRTFAVVYCYVCCCEQNFGSRRTRTCTRPSRSATATTTPLRARRCSASSSPGAPAFRCLLLRTRSPSELCPFHNVDDRTCSLSCSKLCFTSSTPTFSCYQATLELEMVRRRRPCGSNGILATPLRRGASNSWF
jgi:hypothetical protein